MMTILSWIWGVTSRLKRFLLWLLLLLIIVIACTNNLLLLSFSHTSSMALGIAMSVNWSNVQLVQTFGVVEICQHLSDELPWKFCTDIHGALRMNPNDFRDPLTFLVHSERSQPLLDGLPEVWYRYPWSQRMNLNDIGIFLTFLLVPPAGQFFTYPVKYLYTY